MKNDVLKNFFICIFTNEYTYIFFLFIFSMLSSLVPFVPMHYDEVYNFLESSLKSPWWCITNYPFPNNHIFFTFFQSLLLPTSLVFYYPLFLRILNVIYGLLFLLLIGNISKKCGLNKFEKIIMLLTIYFSSPLFLLYFSFARGYILGTLFLLLSFLIIIKNKFYYILFPLCLAL